MAETLIDTGDHPGGHDPDMRRMMASGLAALVAGCRPLISEPGLTEAPNGVVGGTSLWPVPHDARFDFDATSTGAEWIDDIARRARQIVRAHKGNQVVGHGDWRVEHVRVSGGKLSAVYDWDSLRIESEAAIVGSAAHAFTANWEVTQQQLPSFAEALWFIDEYESHRGAPFSADDHRLARASLVYTMAYSARCAHSDELTHFGRHPPRTPVTSAPRPGSAAAFLADHGAELLGSYS
jgi:hypothetical protein